MKNNEEKVTIFNFISVFLREVQEKWKQIKQYEKEGCYSQPKRINEKKRSERSLKKQSA